MEPVIVGLLVMMISILLNVTQNGEDSVQTTLFGGAVMPDENRNETTWINLRKLCMQGKLGDIVEYIVEGFSVNHDKKCITLFFGDDVATTVWMDITPAYREQYPNMTPDGIKLVKAICNATGDTVTTLEEVEQLLQQATNKINRAFIVKVQKSLLTLNDGTEIEFPRWSVRWIDDVASVGGDE